MNSRYCYFRGPASHLRQDVTLCRATLFDFDVYNSAHQCRSKGGGRKRRVKEAVIEIRKEREKGHELTLLLFPRHIICGATSHFAAPLSCAFDVDGSARQCR